MSKGFEMHKVFVSNMIKSRYCGGKVINTSGVSRCAQTLKNFE